VRLQLHDDGEDGLDRGLRVEAPCSPAQTGSQGRLEADGLSLAGWPVGAPCRRALSVSQRRAGLDLGVDGQPCGFRHVPARRGRSGGHVLLVLQPGSCLRRLLLVGRWEAEATLPSTPPLARWAESLRPLPDEVPLKGYSKIKAAPERLGELRARGQRLRARSKDREMIWARGLRGDVEISARVSFVAKDQTQQAGIGIRTRGVAPKVSVYYGLVRGGRLMLLTQRRFTYASLAAVETGAEHLHLRLRRVGDLVFASYGPDPARLTLLPGSPFHIPLSNRIQTGVFALAHGKRSTKKSTAFAEFEQIEVSAPEASH
jgi:hypothetical protein